MAVDLHEMLDSALREGAHELAAETPPPGAVRRWARTVRRRRTVRHLLQVAVILPFVVALGAALWFGLGHGLREAPVATPDPVPVPTTPAPEPTAAPTPDPSPTTPDPTTTAPDPTPDAPPQTIEVPGLPPHLEAPADILTRAAPGWVLSVYQGGEDSRQYGDPVVLTLFLTSPDGDHYRLADVDAEWLEVQHWQAGQERARISFGGFAEGYPAGHTTGWLDVTTGEITADSPSLGSAKLLGFTPENDEVWVDRDTVSLIVAGRRPTHFLVEGAGHRAILNPAGTHLMFDAESGRGAVLAEIAAQQGAPVDLRGVGRGCRILAWLDDVSLLAQCEDDGALRVTLDGTAVSAEPLGDGLAGLSAHEGGVHIAPGVVGLKFRDDAALAAEPELEACAPAAGVWLDGRLVAAPVFDATGRQSVSTMVAHEGVLYLGGEYVCTFGEELPLEEVVRFDPATGTVTTVLPIIGAGEEASRIGAVTSWAIAS